MIVEYRHIILNKVFSINRELNESELLQFQSYSESECLSNGFSFVGNFIPPFDYNNDPLYVIENNFNNGIYSDFKQAREAMKAEAIDIGYENLVIQQIELLSKWFAIPSSISLQYFDLIKIGEFSKFFDDNSKESRKLRRDCVIRFLRNVIPVVQLFPIIEKTKILLDNYVSYGIEGSTIQNINGVYDPEGIYDYINSIPGTSFENAGLAEEPITPQFGYSISEIKQIIMNVFENGIYI